MLRDALHHLPTQRAKLLRGAAVLVENRAAVEIRLGLRNALRNRGIRGFIPICYKLLSGVLEGDGMFVNRVQNGQ